MPMNKTIRISESTLSLLQILKSEYEKNNPELQVEVTHDYMINELIQVYSNRHTVSIDNQDLINEKDNQIKQLVDLLNLLREYIQDQHNYILELLDMIKNLGSYFKSLIQQD